MQKFVSLADKTLPVNKRYTVEAAVIEKADSHTKMFSLVGCPNRVKATTKQINYFDAVDKSWFPLWSVSYAGKALPDHYNDIMTDKSFHERYEPFSKKHVVLDRVQTLLANVTLEGMLSNMRLTVGEPVEVDDKIYNLYLQVKCDGKCNVSGNQETWSGRKWSLSEHMTDQEIVQTGFLAVMTALEHEARELFKYKGLSVFDPHYDIEKLVELRSTPESVVQRQPLKNSKKDKPNAPIITRSEKYRVFCVNWMQYERGSCAKPDGHTLYLTEDHALILVNDLLADRKGKPVPDYYTNPDLPFPVSVDAETYNKIVESKERFIWGDLNRHWRT